MRHINGVKPLYVMVLALIDIDSKIKKLFNDNLSDNEKFILKYYKPLDFLEENSFQRIQENEKEMTKENDPPGGYCVIWSCWYAELRLSNCDKNRKCIVKLALKNIQKNNITLTQYIRNYSVEILKKLN